MRLSIISLSSELIEKFFPFMQGNIFFDVTDKIMNEINWTEKKACIVYSNK